MISKIKSLFIQIKKNPKMVFKLFISYFYKNLIVNTQFLENKNLLEQVSLGKSIVRMGDGDMGILHGKDIFHQKYNKNLERDLREIIKNYNTESNYLFLIPKFINVSNKLLKEKSVLVCWLPFKLEFIKTFNKSAYYGDAHMFYYLDNTKSLFESVLKNKKLLFVSNRDVLTKIKSSNRFNKNRRLFLETPSYGAYEIIDSIYNQILNINELEKGDLVVILSCGCASRVLAYKLSQINIQSLDIGRGLSCLLDNKDYSDTIWATKITHI